ncbi:phosphatase PAP2 family protein [Pseudanabaena sp. FACHB-2040]|uniref:phosphatase PAP2 family protein n=1 Tax=Pseudanabaena sp. FACHB-2040 TaxID=2692859 RepID=UPI00168633C0|nr:phosphatase PAP2 family protein [Pseudanabaena sp. FACHB-2040]MBD2259478.1 phosphatase PAP2 family protein [Pseudanabaena sp. FACHB-2040]
MKRIWLGLVCPLLVFTFLAVLVAANPDALTWDISLMRILHPYANPRLDRVAAIATDFGTEWGVIPATLLLIALALWRQRWRIATYLGLTLVGSSLLNRTLKEIWHRARPALWEALKPHLDFSFPSGHAMSSMTFVAALILINWHQPLRPWLIAYGGLFVAVIGWTRLYLGVHFPSDILAGWMLSIAFTVGVGLVVFGDRPIPDSVEPVANDE